MQFQGERRTPSLRSRSGVQEVRPVDLVTAYGALANGGKKIGHTTILTIKDQTARTSSTRTCRRPASRSSARRPPTS